MFAQPSIKHDLESPPEGDLKQETGENQQNDSNWSTSAGEATTTRATKQPSHNLPLVITLVVILSGLVVVSVAILSRLALNKANSAGILTKVDLIDHKNGKIVNIPLESLYKYPFDMHHPGNDDYNLLEIRFWYVPTDWGHYSEQQLRVGILEARQEEGWLSISLANGGYVEATSWHTNVYDKKSSLVANIVYGNDSEDYNKVPFIEFIGDTSRNLEKVNARRVKSVTESMETDKEIELPVANTSNEALWIFQPEKNVPSRRLAAARPNPGLPQSFMDAYCRYGCGGMSVTFPYYYRPFFGYGYPLVGTESNFPQGYGGNVNAPILASQALTAGQSSQGIQYTVPNGGVVNGNLQNMEMPLNSRFLETMPLDMMRGAALGENSLGVLGNLGGSFASNPAIGSAVNMASNMLAAGASNYLNNPSRAFPATQPEGNRRPLGGLLSGLSRQN